MARGWHVWLMRWVTLPCTFLLLLTACTPPARLPSAPAPGGVAPSESALGPYESGRSYAFGQMLAREQQQNAALQQQLDERGRQIEQLQAEVQQLHQQEAELRGQLEQASAGSGAGTTAPAATAPAREGQVAAAAAAAPPAAEPPAERRAEAAEAEQGEPVAVASLRVALTQEQQRRQAVETELERLKEETSTPALTAGDEAAGELAAAKAQITELRDALADERVQRERMADDLRVLQQRAAHAPPAEANPEDADLRARIDSLKAEKDAIMESFNRSLAASQQRSAELERQLAASQAATAAAAAGTAAAPPASDSEAASIRAENAALRSRLEEEHRRTGELAAKLRVATRVTDLIFKMQAGQAQAQPLPPQ
jgi:DNA repair exonuclease SbcCD ATPase subunit